MKPSVAGFPLAASPAALLIPLGMGIVMASACFAVGGMSLGLFFGPVLLVTFVVPSLVLIEEAPIRRVAVCAALTLGTWGVWTAIVHADFFNLLRCGAVLAAYILALAGLASSFTWIRIERTFAAALTALLGATWLTWPVWLCPWLGGSHVNTIVRCLTVAHPLLALNGVLFSRFDIWDRYPLAYQQLTTLNQDILYTLPGTIAATAAVHVSIGAAGLVLPNLKNWRLKHAQPGKEPTDV